MSLSSLGVDDTANMAHCDAAGRGRPLHQHYRLLDVGCVPLGGRDWECFVRPAEMVRLLRRHGLAVAAMRGMAYNPLAGRWSITPSLAVNYYIVHAKRPHA